MLTPVESDPFASGAVSGAASGAVSGAASGAVADMAVLTPRRLGPIRRPSDRPDLPDDGAEFAEGV